MRYYSPPGRALMGYFYSALIGLLLLTITIRLATELLAPLVPALAVLVFVFSLLVSMVFPNRRL